MLNKMKSMMVVLVLTLGMVVTGCSNKDELTTTLTKLENDVLVSIEKIVDASDSYDVVLIKESKTDLETIINEIELEQEKYETDETEYIMFDKLKLAVNYQLELVNMLIKMSDSPLMAGVFEEELGKMLDDYAAKRDAAYKEYVNYKEELGIETTPVTSTVEEKIEANKEEVKEEEQPKEEVKQEEKKEVKQEEETYYCEWCEANTNHTSDDHIGQCYDCGEEMPAGQMTFNGRSFHCGCYVGDCGICSAPVHKGQEHYSLYDSSVLICNDCAIQEEYEYNCDLTEEGEYAEPTDSACWNCGSTNIEATDAWGNYTCLDCGEYTQ